MSQSTSSIVSFATSLFSVSSLLIAMSFLPVQADEKASARDILNQTIDAHGGEKQWQRQRSFNYVMRNFPLTPKVAEANLSQVDLVNRRNRIGALDGNWTVGFDGKEAWAVGSDVGLPTRFLNLGSFYFIGMPFVFADDGIKLVNSGEVSFKGKVYDSLTVKYVNGVGHSDKDEYVLLIDKNTRQLFAIHHSVTETGVERVTWTFDRWQLTNGLLIPAEMTLYPGWQPENPGDGASFTIENVKLSRDRQSDSIYRKPAA